ALDIVMKCHCNQENWSAFCKRNPTEGACRNMILYAYQFNHYYNITGKLYSVRNDAKKRYLSQPYQIKL
ncbi:9519_t:CDS:1, partial [Entrophospora sp. SA101]